MSSNTSKPAHSSQQQRRRFLRLFGTAAAALPITVLTGCSDDPPPAPTSSDSSDTAQPPPQQNQQAAEAPAQQQPAATDMAEQASDEAEQVAQQAADQSAETVTKPAPAGEMQKLTLDDPSAQALGYQHNAADVDLQKYPQRAKAEAANHYCSNCALFQAEEGAEWGPCALFPGKLVNANGWCSGYAPRQA